MYYLYRLHSIFPSTLKSIILNGNKNEDLPEIYSWKHNEMINCIHRGISRFLRIDVLELYIHVCFTCYTSSHRSKRHTRIWQLRRRNCTMYAIRQNGLKICILLRKMTMIAYLSFNNRPKLIELSKKDITGVCPIVRGNCSH